jgi:hypothetical protein
MEKFGIYVLENFLSNEECDEIIGFVKEKHDKDPHKNRNIKVVDKQRTTRYNSFHSDRTLSDRLWNKLNSRLQDKRFNSIRNFRHTKARKIFEPCGISNKLTTVYYLNGEMPIHKDKFNNMPDKTSLFTILVYLNDDYKKGRTIFYPNYPKTNKENEIALEPKKGRAVLFDINLYHRGELIEGEKWAVGGKVQFKKSKLIYT